MSETNSAIVSLPSLVSSPVRQTRAALYRENEILPDWINVLKWSLVLIGAFTVYHSIEKFVVHASHPFIYNPAEFSCRVVGLSHYTIGLIFMLTARRMRKAAAWAWLAGLGAVGILLCLLFYDFGADRNPVLQMLFFLYFIIHGYRDMVSFYRPLSSSPDEAERAQRRILNLTQACLLLSLFLILVPVYLSYLNSKHLNYEPALKSRIEMLMPYLKMSLIWGWVVLLVCAVSLWRAIRKFPGGNVWLNNRPVLLVLISASLIFLVSPLVGVWTFHLLIMTHFVGWYLYASRRLSTLPNQSNWRNGLWRSIRGSVTGFRVLHVSVAVLFFFLILITYLFPERLVLLNLIVYSKAFYYWNLVHITISFAPK